MRGLHVLRLGRVPFAESTEIQDALHSRRVAGDIPDALLLLEHPHTYTLGRNFKQEHLIATEDFLAKAGIDVHEVDRGGSVTYHGPGQLVFYPIISLADAESEADVVRYLRTLEESIIAAVRKFGVLSQRRVGMTGVWVGATKLASIGVNVSRGISKHGGAINVSTDLSFFEGMVPCGIDRVEMTSLEQVLARKISLDDVGTQVASELARLTHRRLVESTPYKLDVDDIAGLEASSLVKVGEEDPARLESRGTVSDLRAPRSSEGDSESPGETTSEAH